MKIHCAMTRPSRNRLQWLLYRAYQTRRYTEVTESLKSKLAVQNRHSVHALTMLDCLIHEFDDVQKLKTRAPQSTASFITGDSSD